MRRATRLLAASLLAVSIAAPAAAAPIHNPQVSTWEIVCDPPLGTFTVVAKGVPGWRTDFERGKTPILLRAATWYAYEGGNVVDGPYTMTAPRGLAAKLVGPCLLHLDGGTPATFDFRAEDAWFQFP
jgi:hypothetical protein